jgi:hypothetical protein
LLKLHGDYKDARILNTDEELGGYPSKYNKLLDRILDEHGLIVCGWSGEWDHALRTALMRAPNRRYSTFWAIRGDVTSNAEELIKHRRANVISIGDADTFFTTLKERVDILEQSRRQNPLSIELLVSGAKRYLAKPEYRIQLYELVEHEADRVLEQLRAATLAPPAQWKPEEFGARVRTYEAITEALASMAGVLGRWGDDTETTMIVNLIESLYIQAAEVGSGLTVYLSIRSYPAVLVFFGYGLGLARAERWAALHRLFAAVVRPQRSDPKRLVETLFLWDWAGSNDEYWQKIEGLEKHKTPLSDHLCTLFHEWGKRFLGLTPDFELLFERFEVLGSLAQFERSTKEDVRVALQDQNGRVRMSMGRSGWHGTTADRLLAELQSDPLRADILTAGFAGADAELLDLFTQNFVRIARGLRW